MTREQALQEFFSSFGIPAYDETSVYDRAKFPYITYQVIIGDFDFPVSMTASVWYRDDSWLAITNKVEEIHEVLKDGGINIPYDNAGMWLRADNLWAQRMSDESDDTIRRIVLNLIVEFVR